MKILQLIIILIFLRSSLFGQADTVFYSKPFTTVDYAVDYNVSYKNGNERISKILSKNLKYPPHALKDNVSGTVHLSFTIDTLGYPRFIKILKGVREDIDNEAIRCVELLNEWVPRTNNGRKECGHHTLSIKFEKE